jgi:large conductance mechanosensitive channel
MDGKNLWQEFKAFALKGNVVDLALAVIIGGAFGKVVDSLVKNVIMPLIGYIAPYSEGYRTWKLGHVEIGLFLENVVNFLIISGALFFVMVKFLGAIERAVRPTRPGEPTTKECPFCLSIIPARARKCSHCTADLPEAGAPETAPASDS